MKCPDQANPQKVDQWLPGAGVGVEGWKGGMRVTDNGYGISFWSDASVVELVVMAALFCEYSKSC